jgi:hypothetical protein
MIRGRIPGHCHPPTWQILRRVRDKLSGTPCISFTDIIYLLCLPFLFSYFIFYFQSPSSVVDDLNEELNRDVDIIRPAFLNRDVDRFQKPCEKGPCMWGEIPHPMHEKIIGKRKYHRRY